MRIPRFVKLCSAVTLRAQNICKIGGELAGKPPFLRHQLCEKHGPLLRTLNTSKIYGTERQRRNSLPLYTVLAVSHAGNKRTNSVRICRFGATVLRMLLFAMKEWSIYCRNHREFLIKTYFSNVLILCKKSLAKIYRKPRFIDLIDLPYNTVKITYFQL